MFTYRLYEDTGERCWDKGEVHDREFVSQVPIARGELIFIDGTAWESAEIQHYINEPVNVLIRKCKRYCACS